MNLRRLSCLCLAPVLGLMLALFLFQRSAASRLQLENAESQSQDLELSSAESEATAVNEITLDPGELEQLLEGTRDLHKLRAEVARLRREQAEFDQLAKENEALRSAFKAGRGNRRAMPDQKKDGESAGVNAGFAFATPASTIQTLFWAASHGNRQRVLECFAPELQASLESEWASLAERGIANPSEAFRKMTGISVVETQTISPERVILSFEIHSATGTAGARYTLRLIGADWKIAAGGEEIPGPGTAGQ